MSDAGQLQVATYDSAARRAPLVRELVEVVRYRDLLGLLISNITKSRYKRSALGVVWTLLNPLLNMAVLTFAFSHMFRFSIVHYPVYVLSGLILWNFFTQTTTYAMSTLVWGGGLLKRIYLPRSIFAVASIGNGLVNLGLSLVPLLAIILIVGHPVHLTWWFVPLAVLLLAMFSLGVALLMSALAVFFADVVEMYAVVVQVWFFLTPVMYPKEMLPARFVWYLNLNPVYNLLELFRVPIYNGVIPGPHTIIAAVVSAVVSLLVGWWAFASKADELAYRV
jgi:ABC-type polysaccharide/polyol phosphate export permease